MERIGQTDKAVRILGTLLAEDPDNGWVFFPYLKAMDRLGKLQEAVQYWKDHRHRIRPEFLRIPIEADLLVRQGRHPDAIRQLRTLLYDEHSTGQLLEAYLSWANIQGDMDERCRIAAEALAISIDPIFLRNVPVLMTRGKLAIVAQDKNTCEDIIEQIKAINPAATELERLQGDYDRQWPKDAHGTC